MTSISEGWFAFSQTIQINGHDYQVKIRRLENGSPLALSSNLGELSSIFDEIKKNSLHFSVLFQKASLSFDGTSQKSFLTIDNQITPVSTEAESFVKKVHTIFEQTVEAGNIQRPFETPIKPSAPPLDIENIPFEDFKAYLDQNPQIFESYKQVVTLSDEGNPIIKGQLAGWIENWYKIFYEAFKENKEYEAGFISRYGSADLGAKRTAASWVLSQVNAGVDINPYINLLIKS